jgi:outer membrane protein TolC
MLVETQFEALKAELAILIQDSNYYNLTPEFDLYEIDTLPSLDESIMELSKNSRLIKALSMQLNQLAYSRRGFEETGKPNLSFVVQTSLKNAEENFGSSLVMDKPDALIGLQLNFPIGNTTAKSRIARTNLQILQLEKQVDELILSLTSVLTNLHVQITELEQVLKLNQKQILSAQKKTREELKLYNQGRGQLTFVIQSRDSEQTARLNYAGNSLTYHKLLLHYQALVDQLL